MSKDVLNLEPKRLWKHFYDLTLIPRPTGQMTQVCQFVIDFGKSLGLETKQDKAGNVLIIKPASKGMENAPTVIIQSHLDMVPQKNADVNHDFTKDAIQAHIEGNLVKAQSTTLGADNGIGVGAMMAVLEDNSLKHGKLECLFTIDEEVGMIGAFGLQPGFLSGSVMLNLDTEEEGDLTVGCAGGADINAVFKYKDVEADSKDVAYTISLTGLRGGHSGGEIHEGRANANKLMARLLKEAIAESEARLASFNGGSLRNAIPREAFAVVTLLPENEDIFKEIVSEYEAIYKEEYADIEPSLSLKIEKTALPKSLIPEEIQDNLIHALVGCQNGVINMLTSFEGVVETSSNLASVKTSEGEVVVGFLARSSSETRKEEICSSIESVFSMAGAKVDILNPYPGWQPNAQSPTSDMMAKLFHDMFGKDAKVQVVHAGLECGIILSSTPGLDIVSFGPNIRNPHSPDEYVEIDSVERFYKYFVKTLELIK